MLFSFGEFTTNVHISQRIPSLQDILNNNDVLQDRILVIADENTASIAKSICENNEIPFCILKSGEENKNWQAVHSILNAAFQAGLGRDGIFLAVGGGVIGDLAGFASSIYMRGCRFFLVSTTLLGMVDASVGGKTGFDLFNIKNLTGTFYPAENVYIPLETLVSLPQKEWKSGFAELIKTAILSSGDFLDQLTEIKDYKSAALFNSIEKAVLYKGNIVKEDPKEQGKRKLLNLGHTFGHALESAAGLGNITHGEAVAWGMVRACLLGCEIGITPKVRAEKITEIILKFGYECENPHPAAKNTDIILNNMKSDKKKKDGNLTFIVPDETSAVPVIIKAGSNEEKTLIKILKGGITF